MIFLLRLIFCLQIETHRIGLPGAMIQKTYGSEEHKSEKIYLGLEEDEYVIIEVQYPPTLQDLFQNWLGDKEADVNYDGIVNMLDFIKLRGK